MKGMVIMKSWLKWLAETDYHFTVKYGADAREYNFGNGILVVKYETKNGGEIFTPDKRITCKSVKRLTEELENILK